MAAMASFVDALRLAADRADTSRQIYFSWEFIAAAPGPIRASNGLELGAKPGPVAAACYDCAVVCGGLLESVDLTSPWVDRFLWEMSQDERPVLGVCTGTFVIARAGLLEGRRCALHFETEGDFAARYPKVTRVTDKGHVIDGNVITCPGGVTSAWVASILIASYSNRARANKSLNYLLMENAPPKMSHAAAEWHQELDRASPLTQRVVEAMEFRIDAPCSIAQLARQLNISKASLNRSFAADLGVSPARFWMGLRLNAARELLAARRRSVTEVAYETGFCDTAHLSATFRKAFGVTPREYQRQHAGLTESGVAQ